MIFCFFFFFKQKTAYEMRISDWSSDVCSSDLLDPSFANGAKQVDGFEARLFGDRRCGPEALDAGAVLGREVHMRGERRGEPADLAPAHRVGLAGDREGRGARLADASRRQMEIEDRVDLIGAGGRLVDPFAEQGDGTGVRREQFVEAPEDRKSKRLNSSH